MTGRSTSVFFKTEPRKHQYSALSAAYGHSYFAFFMEQGTGKSKVTIDLLSTYFIEKKEGTCIDAVLLIAPSGVHEQWFDEQLPEHAPIPYHAYLWEGNPGSYKRIKELSSFIDTKSSRIKWFLINIEAMATQAGLSWVKEYLNKNRCAVVVDEATIIKNPKAACTSSVVLKVNELLYSGKYLIKVNLTSVVRILLTGTHVTNNPFDLYSYGEFLLPNFWNMSYVTFKAHFGLLKTFVKQGSAGKGGSVDIQLNKEDIKKIHALIVNNVSTERIAAIMKTTQGVVSYLRAHPDCMVPYRNLVELKNRIAHISFSVLKKDCYDLPVKQKLISKIHMSREQKEVYASLIKEHYAEYNNKELDVTTKLALITRLSQVAGGFFPTNDRERPLRIKGNNKITAILREIEELDEFPLIICARFTAELELLSETLRAPVLYGPTPSIERRDLVSKFKNKEIDILLVQPEVCSMGYNFQVSCNMFFYSTDYSIDTREQMEDRIHRDGQDSDHVVYRDFVAVGTVDERIQEVLKEKKSLLDYMREPISINEFLGG